MGEAYKNNGGAHRKKHPAQDDIILMVKELRKISSRLYTQIEIDYLYEMNKLINRGKTITNSESKLILDLYRREVV